MPSPDRIATDRDVPSWEVTSGMAGDVTRAERSEALWLSTIDY
jgi:hypothetical protein